MDIDTLKSAVAEETVATPQGLLQHTHVGTSAGVKTHAHTHAQHTHTHTHTRKRARAHTHTHTHTYTYTHTLINTPHPHAHASPHIHTHTHTHALTHTCARTCACVPQDCLPLRHRAQPAVSAHLHQCLSVQRPRLHSPPPRYHLVASG